MAWGPFSAEAITLAEDVRKMQAKGQSVKAVTLVERALAVAYALGPSNKSYEEFEKELDRKQND